MYTRMSLSAALLAAVLLLSGCGQLSALVDAVADDVGPEPAATAPAFESPFTDDGSVSLSTDVADDLEVRLDVWAVASPAAETTFGMAVNAYDYRAPENAVLAQKRHVYLSLVTITSTLNPSQAAGPLQLTTDPRTLVPSDTLQSDRGLLVNSRHGGLLIPETTIPPLPEGTDGITLDIVLTLSVDADANGAGTRHEVTVHHALPIAAPVEER